MLDFAPAAEYLTTIAQTTGVDGLRRSSAQLMELRHALEHTGPTAVLPQVRTLVAAQPTSAALDSSLAYLETRVAQLQYPQWIAGAGRLAVGWWSVRTNGSLKTGCKARACIGRSAGR